MKKQIVLLLATGFGLGLSPVASGTVGGLLGVPIVFLMGKLGAGFAWQAVLTAGMVLAALPICNEAEKYFGRKDDGRIVADEYLTFPLCVLGLPWIDYPWLLAFAFVSSRLMDVTKPPPARQSQKIRGGLGIVIDDVIANLYALILNHAVYWAFKSFLHA